MAEGAEWEALSQLRALQGQQGMSDEPFEQARRGNKTGRPLYKLTKLGSSNHLL